MKSLSHHIRTVKGKPHHIRKRVAFGAAFVVAGVIGAIWAGASLATGAFAIKGSSFADATSQKPVVATTPTAASLAASPAEAGTNQEPAHIEIVDAKPKVAPAPAATSIPF